MSPALAIDPYRHRSMGGERLHKGFYRPGLVTKNKKTGKLWHGAKIAGLFCESNASIRNLGELKEKQKRNSEFIVSNENHKTFMEAS